MIGRVLCGAVVTVSRVGDCSVAIRYIVGYMKKLGGSLRAGMIVL